MSVRLRADAVLLAVASLIAIFWFGSAWLLARSQSFWESTLAADQGRAVTYPLQMEARLALLEKPRVQLVAFGSSVAVTDVGWRRVAQSRGLGSGELLAFGLPGGQGFELAQLAPRLAQLQPQQVVFLETPWLLHDFVDWDGLRFYDPAVSLRVLGWRRSLEQHGMHASGLLNSSHAVLRRRDALRDLLFWDARYATEDRSGEKRLARRLHARPEEFSCASPHLAALAEGARTFTRAGAEFFVVPAPHNDPRLPRDAAAQLDECLGRLAAAVGFQRIHSSQLPAMSPDDFADWVHLNPAARRRFTTALIDLLPGLPARRP